MTKKFINFFICFVLSFFSFMTVFATETHIFRSGLALPQSYNYGRTAQYTDQLAYQLASGTFKSPVADHVAFNNRQGEPVRWVEVQADDNNRFNIRLTGRPFGGIYYYVAYTSNREQNALLHVIGCSMVYANGEPRGGDIYSDGFLYLPDFANHDELAQGIRNALANGASGI